MVKLHNAFEGGLVDHTLRVMKHAYLINENNLIKKYQPRYNVLLKDDKTYPWICIKKERFPRIFLTRNVINGDCEIKRLSFMQRHRLERLNFRELLFVTAKFFTKVDSAKKEEWRANKFIGI